MTCRSCTVLAEARSCGGGALLGGHQRDLVLDGAGTAAGKAGAHVPQQGGYRHVVIGDQRGEAVDAFGAGPGGQPGQQFGAQSTALPVVDDGDGDLGGVRVVGIADVAGDAHAASVGLIQSAKCFVV